jgi:hypothetical protein
MEDMRNEYKILAANYEGGLVIDGDVILKLILKTMGLDTESSCRFL